jgi:Tol biopolymer transport system component
VKDYVSGLALTDAQVTIGTKSHKTDAAGGYSFEKMPAGEYTLTFSKTGYAEKAIKATVLDAALTVDATELVPKGQIIFVSNREAGKRGLFVTNYDGSDQKAFVARSGDGEDYGQSISPDGKWVVFSSTRDGVKNSYGNSLARLYIVGRDGSGLKKVNDDVSHEDLVWSSNSRFLYYRAYSDAQQTTAVNRFYDTQKGVVLDLGETSISTVTFSHDGNSVVYILSKYGENDLPTYTNYLKFLNVATGERKTIVTKTGNPFSDPNFTTDDKSLEYEQIIESTRHRYRVTTNDGTETSIDLPTVDGKVYWPSPDGLLKAFLDVRDGKRDLFLVDKNGKNEKRLSKLGVANQYLPITWDDNGHYVIFAVTREDENAVYIVSLDGGDPKKVTDFSAGSGYPGYY